MISFNCPDVSRTLIEKLQVGEVKYHKGLIYAI